MLRSSLRSTQRQIAAMVETLDYGAIHGLSIRDGLPQCDPPPRIHQSIKLDSDAGKPADQRNAELTMKKEFERLFEQLERLRDAVVNIEVRHGLPVRLVVERAFVDFDSE